MDTIAKLDEAIHQALELENGLETIGERIAQCVWDRKHHGGNPHTPKNKIK